MLTAFYAALCALLLVKLCLYVVKLRRFHRTAHGDGNIKELQIAIGAHSNASQYIPISLILMLTLEISQTPHWLLHLFGIALLTGRLMHAYGMFKQFKYRVWGMYVTVYNMITLSVANIIYYLI